MKKTFRKVFQREKLLASSHQSVALPQDSTLTAVAQDVTHTTTAGPSISSPPAPPSSVATVNVQTTLSSTGSLQQPPIHISSISVDNNSHFAIMRDQYGVNMWTVELSRTWDVLGPFPIHAREQHFLSPSFPLNLIEPVNFNLTWPSSYADGGHVSWSKVLSEEDRNVIVSFPDIRWNALRATEGWAALQHHTVLRTSLTLFPPPDDAHPQQPPHLRVELKQGTFFTILPTFHSRPDSMVPQWYPGNVYDMERSLPVTMSLPVPPSTSAPTEYDVFVSGDYEIRLFGDPRVSGNDVPTLTVNLSVNIEHPEHALVHEPTQDVVCDFVDGFAFGDAIGIGIRSLSGWWTLQRISYIESTENISLTPLRTTRIAPTQTRIVPFRLTQTAPFHGTHIRVTLTWKSEFGQRDVEVTLPIRHRSAWNASHLTPIHASYFFAETMPTPFLVMPPVEINTSSSSPGPPILVLHGSGADVITQPFLFDSISRQRHSWIVFPTGRTSWGLDWHGPSAQDAWGSLSALHSILNGRKPWKQWKYKEDARVVVMGHSNGGQGAWYLASRYPDRVLAVIAASAYIKSEAYVPLTMSRSARFIDPSLRAILESSLTPDDNTLFLSNLVHTPVLAIHGGLDDNVPTWHSREAVSVLKTWDSGADVTLREDVGQPHWYPWVFMNARVQAFLDSAFELYRQADSTIGELDYALTVAAPFESGRFHGWRIESLDVPGRLARLHVHEKDGRVRIKTTNVNSFSTTCRGQTELVIDDTTVTLPITAMGDDQRAITYFQANERKAWTVSPAAAASSNTQYVPCSVTRNRAQAILTTLDGPLTIVVPSTTTSHELSIALRLSHALHVYHRLDTEIIAGSEVLSVIDPTGNLTTRANMIVVGGLETDFAQCVLEKRMTPFEVVVDSNPSHKVLRLGERSLVEPGLGILFTHPGMEESGMILFLSATDEAGLEKVARLFPIRTGVAVPDWLIIGEWADNVGAAGVIGAGVWGTSWTLNQQMTWLY